MNNPIVFNEHSKDIIRTYNTNTYDLICMTKASRLLENQEYRKVENAFADYISGAIENKLNENFHSGLTTLEQNGILSVEKILEHEKRVKRTKAITAGVTTFAFEAAPLVFDYLSDCLSKENIKKFIIGWTAYINGKYDSETVSLVKGFLEEMGINLKSNDYENIFNEYVNASQVHMSSLQLSKISKRNLSGDNITIVAKKIVSICDLSDDNVYQRALEFVAECLHIRFEQAEEILKDSQSGQILNSEFIGFSALNYVTYFQPLINSIDTAKKFAYYDVESDRYSKLRETRKAAIDNAVSLDVVETMKNIHPTLAKIYVSIGLAKKSLNPDCNVKRVFDIQKIKKLMMTELI